MQGKTEIRAQAWLHGREKQSQLPRPVTTKGGTETEGVRDTDRTVSENPGQSQLTSTLPCKRRDRKVRRTGDRRKSSCGPIITSSPSARTMSSNVPVQSPHPVPQVEKLRPKMARM